MFLYSGREYRRVREDSTSAEVVSGKNWVVSFFLAPSSWAGVLSANMSHDLIWPVAQDPLFGEAFSHAGCFGQKWVVSFFFGSVELGPCAECKHVS